MAEKVSSMDASAPYDPSDKDKQRVSPGETRSQGSAYRPNNDKPHGMIRKQPRVPQLKKDGNVSIITPFKAKSSVTKPRFAPNTGLPTWQNYVQALALFYAYHRHFNVPPNYVDRENGLNLGTWVNTVRSEYAVKLENPTRRSQILTARRVAVLEAMGFDWSHPKSETAIVAAAPRSTWEEEFLQAKAGSDVQFVAWAKAKIRIMRAEADDARLRAARSQFAAYQLNFRISLLELAVEKIYATDIDAALLE